MLIGWLIALFLVVDAMIVCAVFAVVASHWNDLADRFPGCEVREPSVRKAFQSVKLGILNLGGSVHIAVDERAMHLEPTWFLRKLRARRASVPWEAMELRSVGRGRFARVRIGKEDMVLPRWAVSPLEATGGKGPEVESPGA